MSGGLPAVDRSIEDIRQRGDTYLIYDIALVAAELSCSRTAWRLTRSRGGQVRIVSPATTVELCTPDHFIPIQVPFTAATSTPRLHCRSGLIGGRCGVLDAAQLGASGPEAQSCDDGRRVAAPDRERTGETSFRLSRS